MIPYLLSMGLTVTSSGIVRIPPKACEFPCIIYAFGNIHLIFMLSISSQFAYRSRMQHVVLPGHNLQR
jgi:hypothetical protein